MNDHTLFVREGQWQIAGSIVDVAGNPNIAIGLAVVTHSGALWILEEQVNELLNRYTILPLAAGATATNFNGVNGVMGELRGAFIFFDDLILLTYTSTDGVFHGTESLRMLDQSRYETRGALFRDGGHVSSWSYTLQRA
ncbi:MAG TPA: hypothetical protein VE010_19295 [Thermoanaerobaculia bacterium]|nr:hypothetical protein [Thermoanaerobaculia bacterium]